MTQLSMRPTAGQVSKQPLLNGYEIRLMVRDLVREQGVALEQLLPGSGVSARQLENPAHHLTLEQELLLYTRVAEFNTDPLLGIRTGSRLSLADYGMLGHAMMGVATLNEALQLLDEFAPLVSWASHSRLTVELSAGRPCKCLTLFPTALDPAAAALEIESTFASLQALFNGLAGEPVQFASLEMVHSPREPDIGAYRELFRCEVVFNASRNALLIPIELLSTALPHPQLEYRELFRDLCRREVTALTEDRGLVATVKALLRGADDGAPSLEQLAAHFGQSARTLRRRLQDVGASYQGLLDETRFEQARHYLAFSDLPVLTIASRLGYADARSFRTAFRRWAGTAPGHYRRALRGES